MVEWRTIKDYPDYQVSDRGEVRSLKFNKIRILKQAKTGVNCAYRAVELWKNKQGKRHYVHRLVLEHFYCAPPTNKHECNHKDGNKTNNIISNLEWTTSSENKIHGFQNGLYPSGDNCSWAKLTQKDIDRIKQMRQNGMTHQAIANQYSVQRRQVGRILDGTRWKNYGS